MKKKHKFLKTFSFASLALLMGIAGTMAFAPLGASPSMASANASESEMTTEQGLITPKADDPVIYTTESGLEIKWGNYKCSGINGNQIVHVENNGSSLGSGNLSGFPYFVTNDGTTDYTWVIIGKASDVGTSIGSNASAFLTDIKYDTLTNWKTTNTATNEYGLYYYFFNSIYEEITPAATALKSDNMLNDTTAWRAGGINMSMTLNSSVVTDTRGEIPSGCVLVIANECTGTGVRNTSSAGYYYYSDSTRCYRYNYHTTWAGTARTVMENYYKNGTLGLAPIKYNIVPVTLTTLGKAGSTTTSQSWSSSTQVVENCYVYTLSGTSTDTFYALNYLTAAQATLSTRWWLRGGNSTSSTYVNGGSYDRYYYPLTHTMSTAGAVEHALYTNGSAGYRPAFCLKVV